MFNENLEDQIMDGDLGLNCGIPKIRGLSMEIDMSERSFSGLAPLSIPHPQTQASQSKDFNVSPIKVHKNSYNIVSSPIKRTSHSSNFKKLNDINLSGASGAKGISSTTSLNGKINRTIRRVKKKGRDLIPCLPPGKYNGQRYWRKKVENDADTGLDYSSLYLELKSHAKVRQAIRKHITERDEDNVSKRHVEIQNQIETEEKDNFDRFIRGSSGFNTSYSIFLKRPKPATTVALMERKAKMKAEKNLPGKLLRNAVRQRMFRALRTGVLDLRTMHLDAIPPAAWSTLLLQGAMVEQILFTRNNIKEIPEYMVPNFRPAKHVDLSRNQLKHIPDSFDGNILSNLKLLRLDLNPISVLPNSLATISSLEIFHCCDTHVHKLPDNVRGLKNLRELKCCRNRLVRLPGELNKLKNLEVLDVSDNQLISLAIIPRINYISMKDKMVSVGENDPSEDWEKVVDPRSGKEMYYNRKRGVSRRFKPMSTSSSKSGMNHSASVNQDNPWEADSKLAHGWYEEFDHQSNSVYYYNERTNASTYDIPPDAVDSDCSDEDDVNDDDIKMNQMQLLELFTICALDISFSHTLRIK